jgi:hypothetical protein
MSKFISEEPEDDTYDEDGPVEDEDYCCTNCFGIEFCTCDEWGDLVIDG